MPRLPLRFPNILDRYVMRKYLAVFALVALSLLSISVIVTFFERIGSVYEHEKPVALLFEYIYFRLPEFIYYILPVAALTTTLLALGFLTKFNETTAMKACGISLYRLIVPVLFLALLVCGASFYVQERLLPFSNKKVEDIWNRINDVPARSYSYINRHWVLSKSKDRIYHYDYFDPAKFVFSRLSVFEMDLETWSLKRRYDSQRARFSREKLLLERGWTRAFVRERPVSFETKRRMDLPGAESQGYFLKEWKVPSQMTFRELRGYTKEVGEMGFETSRFRVDLNYKISFPFAGLVMTLLGIPFAFSMGKRGALVGIGLSIAIAMVYWGAIGIFRSLGYVDFLSGFLAAWAPNLVFGLMGLYLIFRLRT
jgi:LPS export ABC transporter permease LptG